MAQPTLLNVNDTSGSGDTTSYSSGISSTTSTTFANVTVPATANTVLMFAGIDKDLNDGVKISDLDFGSGADQVNDVFNIELMPATVTSPTSPRVARLYVFNTANLGALDLTVTLRTDASVNTFARLGVICTNGYLQSLSTYFIGTSQDVFGFAVGSDTENQLAVDASLWDGQNSAAYTSASGGGTKQLESSGNQPTFLLLSQDTATSNGVYKFDGAWDAANDCQGLRMTLSSKPNPFEGNPNKNIISHNIIN